MRPLLFLLLLVALPTFPEPAGDPAELERQLEALEAEIDKFKTLLESTEGEKDSIEQTLKRNEQNINELLKRIREIEGDIDQGEENISRLELEQGKLRGERRQQQALIESQIRAAYKIGHQEYLKVVLNQEDPNELSRMLTYYDYFNRARAAQVEKFNDIIRQLDLVSAEIAAENLQLANTRNELAVQSAELESAQAQRRQTLAQLQDDIRTTGNELERLQVDREQLEQLLTRIQRQIANLPTPADTAPFASMRGKLLLPIAGKVDERFGNRRSDGKMRWNGMLIAAKTGTPVRAVHYGRVVFSDWLRGFGLLMIINHGEGYMSLYGHNQVLYREPGDWVVAGEPIAEVGNTGGQRLPGLYFEIRVEGDPADPQQWCQARPSNAA